MHLIHITTKNNTSVSFILYINKLCILPWYIYASAINEWTKSWCHQCAIWCIMVRKSVGFGKHQLWTQHPTRKGDAEYGWKCENLMFLNFIVKLESRPRRQTLEYKNTVIINVERTFLIRNKKSIIFKQICQFLSKYLSLVHNDYISICMYEICPYFFLFLFETRHINWRLVCSW